MEGNVSEIYTRIGQRIVDSIEDKWINAELHIEYVGSVKTILNYSHNDESKNTGLIDSFKNMRDIKKLHEITTENPKNKWNRAVFSIKPDGDFDMEFIWDQELQDKVESFK